MGKQGDYRSEMERCRAYIDAHGDTELTAAGLAEQFGYSASRFSHAFREVVGVSVSDYIRTRKLCRAEELLRQGQSVSTAAAACGFRTAAGFTRAFTRQFGMTPQAYKRRRAG